MKKIKTDIQSKHFTKAYLLYGPEGYLRAQYANMLCDAIVPKDNSMNRLALDGDNLSEQDVMDFLDTMPFFSDYRLVFIKNSNLFKGKAELLPDYIKNIPDTAVLVFSETEIDKRSKMYKAVAKVGYISEFQPLKDWELSEWGRNILTQSGLGITKADMDYIVSRTGNDMFHLSLELDKLVCFCAGRNTVTRQDIETVIGNQVENHIFDMIDAVSAGNTEKALNLYGDLLALKEPPLRILYLIGLQFNRMYQIKLMQGECDIPKKLGLHPYAAKKLAGMAGTYSLESLRLTVEHCAELETSVKTGKLSDRLSVELALMNA